jgi:hypothetical protein
VPEMSRHRKLGKTQEILVLISPPFYHRKTVGQLIFRCKAIQFCRMDFEISPLIEMNLADLKSLVSVGEVPPDPTESRRKKSPVSRKRNNVSLKNEHIIVNHNTIVLRIPNVPTDEVKCQEKKKFKGTG